jgi:uncharacterized protein YrzB (UPF0473 family)
MGNDNDMDAKQFSLFDGSVEAAPAPRPSNEPMRPSVQHSSYVVYVDESGDHGLQSIDPQYPVFVLAFCVFHKRHYSERVIPALHSFKFRHFGHDHVILHENEIRKEQGHFNIFRSRQQKEEFIQELATIVEASNFILISCVIDKTALAKEGGMPPNPYHLALGFCLETLYDFLVEKSQHEFKTHVIVERRGDKEDKDLELEFRRICDGNNKKGQALPFDVVFAHKTANSTGLQFADLIARPVGLSVCRPKQPNRAFEGLKPKFYCSGGRENVGVGFEGWGLKIYP